MKKYCFLAIAALIAALLPSCDDDTSTIGSTISNGEVSIVADSMVMNIAARCVEDYSFDARTSTKLIGRINVPEYGSLSSAFVTQLMPATRLLIPDSITEERIDSLKLVLSIPRGYVTGDSLAPQQLRVYKLDSELPDTIRSSFPVSEYYSESGLLGTRSYTVSAISQNDTLFRKATHIPLDINMTTDMAREVFRRYRTEPEIFQWPSTFQREYPFHGLYVEQNFGNGCMAGVTGVNMFMYWNRTDLQYTKLDSVNYGFKEVTVKDSICVFSSQPEVLSSNIISYSISDRIKQIVNSGKSVITTPGGYHVDITMPAREIIDRYNSNSNHLSVVSDLSITIPAKDIDNDFNIGTVPYLLLIKSSEREKFFAENKIPDNKTSFYATYSSTGKNYVFSGLRRYITDLIQKGEIEPDDVEFSILPVLITTESQKDSYYGSESVYVVKCAPYMARPTMTELDTDNVTVQFTYSNQNIE